MAGVLIGSIVFLGLYIVSAYFISDKVTRDETNEKLKSEYRAMAIGLTFLAFLCMWLMWVSVYMHQMNPIIQPILDKELLENQGHH